jgi:hypothetical protein
MSALSGRTLSAMKSHAATCSARSGVIALAVLLCTSAQASEKSARLNTAAVERSHFVEFRVRPGSSIFGHVYVAYGRLNAKGNIAQINVVGFSDGDDARWHFYSKKGSVDPLTSDTTYFPIVRYRRHLTSVQFQQLEAKILQVRRAQPPYHMLFFNCTDFAGELAETIGLRRPPSLLFPSAYVAWLRVLNNR